MHYAHLPLPQPLHIPDGFLSILVSAIFWAAAVMFVGLALRKTRQRLGERSVPLMGVLAAAIFAGQMLNFSIPGGTSGHLMGAALAVILLGLWPSVLVMTSVVAVQALLFQDGGILTLGANIFNMGVVGVFVSNAVYSGINSLLKNHRRGILIAGFAAAWLSIMAAAMTCALQLALSGTSPANVAVPAMAAIHAVIGLGEGLITVGALTFLLAARSDLLNPAASSQKGLAWAGGLLVVLLAVLSPMASRYPDGLEAVAEQKGFLDFARDAGYQIFPDYTLPGLNNPVLMTIAAGLIGAGAVFLLVYGLMRLEKRNTAESLAKIADE